MTPPATSPRVAPWPVGHDLPAGWFTNAAPHHTVYTASLAVHASECVQNFLRLDMFAVIDRMGDPFQRLVEIPEDQATLVHRIVKQPPGWVCPNAVSGGAQ